MRTAIVTTLRNADATLAYFVAYHLAIGFDHLFLFFDDPNDPLYDQYSHHPAITAVKHDDTLRKHWRFTNSYAENYPYYRREVMARQIMNVDVAVKLALANDIDWLLHIDSDELFYSPMQSVKAHFSALSNQGIKVAQYLNHEAVPETASITNYFTEVSLFKRNSGTFTVRQKALLNSLSCLNSPYFSFYDNGKSASAVHGRTQPMGVHQFETAHQPISRPEGPYILHFPCCGFFHFLAKYRTLGQFANKWFNRGDDISLIAPIHVWSREAVQSGDESLIRRFYDEVFISRYTDVTDLCIQEGIFFRLQVPALSTLLKEKANESIYA